MDTVDYELLHDHAVIRFSGELTWESATELANLIDTLTIRYFNKRIELVIHSPGGLAAALEHLARAISGWRERGVHLRTRVVASAASAAAVLLSMGDERIAEPEARLLYHLSRVLDPGAVTAHASARIHDELARIDARIIHRLVERALREPNAAHPHQGAPSDRRMLQHLIEATPRSHDTRPSRSVKHLARALGRAVDDAVRGRDRKALTRVYQALAETDLAISAPLARTLRLIDHVGVPEPHPARPAATPGSSRRLANLLPAPRCRAECQQASPKAHAGTGPYPPHSLRTRGESREADPPQGGDDPPHRSPPHPASRAVHIVFAVRRWRYRHQAAQRRTPSLQRASTRRPSPLRAVTASRASSVDRRRPLLHRAPCGASVRWREGKPEGGQQERKPISGCLRGRRPGVPPPRLPLP